MLLVGDAVHGVRQGIDLPILKCSSQKRWCVFTVRCMFRIPVHHYKTPMTTPHVTTRAELEVEVSQAIDAYLQCFLANNMDGINATIAYPLSLISDGHTSLCSEFPMSPKHMMEETGWHTTVNITSTVAGVNGNKAHVTSSGTRVRQDGSVIENYDVFYALTKTSGNWKIFAVSQVVYPVNADQS